MTSSVLTHSIAEAARRIPCGERWLADECRAGRVEHVLIGKFRRLTDEQIERVIASRTQKPKPAAARPGYRIPPSRRRRPA